MAVQRVDFPQPPRITGNPAADLPVLVEYLWSFYQSAILSGGLIQNTQLSSQLQTQFARLYNLAVLAGGAANKLPYLTSADGWSLADITDDARSLMSKDSVADMLTFLGIVIYTAEQVRDTIATFIQNGFGINWTHDDAGDTLTPDITMPTYTVATVPDAVANVRRWIYVSNEAGGATPAFSDGAAWRRVSDLAVVS